VVFVCINACNIEPKFVSVVFCSNVWQLDFRWIRLDQKVAATWVVTADCCNSLSLRSRKNPMRVVLFTGLMHRSSYIDYHYGRLFNTTPLSDTIY